MRQRREPSQLAVRMETKQRWDVWVRRFVIAGLVAIAAYYVVGFALWALYE
jgi:hypothetical protein